MGKSPQTAVPLAITMAIILSTLTASAVTRSQDTRWTGTATVTRTSGNGLLVEGTPVSIIVTRANPPKDVAMAVADLKSYITRMTGVKLNHEASDGPLPPAGAIVLGQRAWQANVFTTDELKDAGYEGYRIRARNKNIWIAGGKYWGNYYGACHFLERLGARFYSRDCEVIPAKAQIQVADMEIVSQPVFQWRNLKFTHMRQGQHIQLYHSMRPNDADPTIGRVHWIHSSAYLVPYETYAKSNPEYFAAQFRDRLHTDYVRANAEGSKLHICLSNPDVRRIAKERLIMAMDKQQDRRLFAATQADGQGWCNCADCKALDPEGATSKTDRYLDFVNELARAAADRHPDALILAQAYVGGYNGTAEPPVRVKAIEPNVRIVMAPYTPEVQDKGHWFDHPLNAQFKPWYDGWVRYLKPGQLFIFDYPYADFRGLTFFHELYFERVKRYAADGVRGIYFDSRAVFMDALFEHVIARLTWNPALETRPLVEEFISVYYRGAGPVMQQIYDRLHAITYPYERSQGPSLDMRKLLTASEIDELLLLFAEAEAKAAGDETATMRVQRDKSYLLFRDIALRNPANGRENDTKTFKKKLATFIGVTAKYPSRSKARILLRTRPANDFFRGWMWNVARLKITAKTAIDDPVIQDLINAPDKVVIPPYTPPQIRPLANGKGWALPLELSEGASVLDHYDYECPMRRNLRVLRTRATEYNIMRVRFSLPTAPGKATLVLVGLDDDKPGATDIRIALNDKPLHTGENKFAAHDWHEWRLPIPAGALVKGDNLLAIENLEEGLNVYAEWMIVANIKIETEDAVSARPPKTLFLAHFDKAVDADLAANPTAMVKGKVGIASAGKWGGALDVGYGSKPSGTVSFNTHGSLDPHQGTIEMWVKPKWAPNADEQPRAFFRVRNNQTLHNGLMLTRAYKRPLQLSVYDYGPAGQAIGDVSSWRKDTWHHVAVTWNQDASEKQLFIDGVLAGKEKLDAIPKPDVLYVGSILHDLQSGRPAEALIDELRISDAVLWQGSKIGEKVFDLPNEPYSAK